MSLLSRPAPKPQPTRCHQCERLAAEAVCSNCGTERPALTALKNITRKALTPYPPCKYFRGSLCGCGERGACLEAA